MVMKKNKKKNTLPILGWSEVSECYCYEELVEDIATYGEGVVYNSDREFGPDEKCAFVFYNEYPKNLFAVFRGTVEYIGRYPDHLTPYAYIFTPEKEVIAESIGYCKECGDPKVVVLKKGEE